MENVEEIKKPEEGEVKEYSLEEAVSRMDALDAEVKQLRDDIANLYAKLESKEEVETKSEKMSAQKKFTGAPIEEQKCLSGLVNVHKVENSMSRVFAKMANSKLN